MSYILTTLRLRVKIDIIYILILEHYIIYNIGLLKD